MPSGPSRLTSYPLHRPESIRLPPAAAAAASLQEFVKIARLRLQMSRIGVPPNAEMQARAEGKDPSAVAAEVCFCVCIGVFVLCSWTFLTMT